MKKPEIICLAGFPCSGKDTVGSIISKKYGYDMVAFGNTLKQICADIRLKNYAPVISFMVNELGLSGEDAMYRVWNYRQLPCYDKKDRLLLQTLGTDFRKIRDDIWVRPVREYANTHGCVITDCRRKFELNSFPEAIKIFIDVPDHIIYERLKKRDGYYDVDILTRESEIEIPDLKEMCHYVIDNSGTIEELTKQVYSIFKEE